MGVSLSIMSIDLPFWRLEPSRDPRSSVGVAFSRDIRAMAKTLRIRVKRALPKARTAHFHLRVGGPKGLALIRHSPLYAYKGKAEAMASLWESKEG